MHILIVLCRGFRFREGHFVALKCYQEWSVMVMKKLCERRMRAGIPLILLGEMAPVVLPKGGITYPSRAPDFRLSQTAAEDPVHLKRSKSGNK